MKVDIQDAGPLRKTVTISYTPGEVKNRREQVLRELAGQVKLDGFRPGKTPAALIEKRYGAAATEQLEERLAQDGVNQAIRDSKLTPLGELEAGKPNRDQGFSLSVSFEIKPAITLPDVKSFGIVEEPIAVTDAEIDEVANGIARRAGTTSALVEGETIVADDSIVVSGSVSVGGAEVKKLHDFHHLVGGYAFLGLPSEEVVKLFAGKRPGDAVSFTATLPKAFQPAEHAGKEAQIAVTVQSGQRLRAATLDDALAARVGFESVAKMREFFHGRLKEQKDVAQRQKLVKQLADKLVEQTKVEVPPRILERTIQANVAEAEKRTAGKPAAEVEQAKQEATKAAQDGIKRFLIIDAAANALNVTVTNQDLSDQIRMAAAQTGRKAEDIAKQLQTSGQGNQVVAEIREAKTLELLLDQALGKGQAQSAKA